MIVGLDRHVLQTVSFDFRARHPHKILIKLIRKLIPADDGREFLAVAYPMLIDLYKTFAPIKQTSFTMALAVIELTARLLHMHIDKVIAGLPPLDERSCHTTRACVIETIMDLLDLYTEYSKLTKVGPRFELNKFIDIKIKINKEVDERPNGLPIADTPCEKCEASKIIAALAGPQTAGAPSMTAPVAPPTATRFGSVSGSGSGAGSGSGSGSGSGAGHKKDEGTMRYMLEAEKMQAETAEVAEYYKEEYDEDEIEVDELIPEPIPRGGGGGGQKHNSHSNSHSNSHGGSSNGSRSHGPSRRERNSHSSHRGGGGSSNGANGNSNGESSGWAPYPRSRNDRHKQRKGGGSSSNGGGGFY